MNHAVLSISVEITKKDGKIIPNNSKVALGNNFSFLDGMRTFLPDQIYFFVFSKQWSQCTLPKLRARIEWGW